MAATLTPDGELTYFSFPIEKTSETEGVNPVDGTPDLIVYGKATDGSVDSDLQIVDQDWSAKAIRDWLDTGGNLRVQHQARRDPAGVGLEVDVTPDGHFVKALVTEPVAKHLVRTKTLQDFSIGVTHPDIRPDPTGKAMNGIITGRNDGMSKISEISLVDRGSNFNSKFQLVKAAGDGAPEFIGKMFVDPELNGAIVTSDETPSGTRVTPADIAKMLTGRDGVTKRKMDPDVGGGVDRDKIPASDFAGRDRSFPIVTPGDVSDAASSIGRAGSDNYSSDQLKKNIIRIARRKGASFVAELPEAWKKELGMSDSEKDTEIEVEKTVDEDVDVEKKKKGKIPPQFLKDDDDSEDAKDDEKESKAEKLSGSGESEPGDADDSSDEDDNDDDEDDSDSEKSAAVEVEKVVTVEKKSKVMCKGCGANVHDEHKFCPECGDKLNDALPIKKNHSFTCLDCGNQLDNGEKFCPECGTKHPGFAADAAKAAGGESDGNSQGKVKKAKKAKAIAKKATPTDTADEAADADPVPEHREPDGPAIEALEHDAGLPTVPDSSVKATEIFFPGDLEASASMRLKMLNAPTDYGMLHDLVCPCYHPDDVAKSYPGFDLTRVDVNHWQRKAFDMAASAPLDQARKATELWQHVVMLKSIDPRELMAARSDIYKEFRDANPGPGSFPTPGAIHARAFNHPLMTAGHEAASPGHSGPNTSPGSFGQISASMYDRGALTAGHAAESPSANRGPDLPVSIPTNPGVPTRTYYTNAMRNNARQAMLAMHDHIAQTFPDLCPAYTTAGPYHSETLPGSRPVPAGVGGPTPHGATKAAKKAKGKAEPNIFVTDDAAPVAVVSELAADKAADVTKAATLDMNVVQDIVTKAVTAVNEARDAEVADLKKTLRKMRKQVETLAAQPDPGGPYRGVAFDQISKTVATQEVLPSVKRAEHAQEAMFRAMYEQFRGDPNPMQREAALRELMKMSGITNSTYK